MASYSGVAARPWRHVPGDLAWGAGPQTPSTQKHRCPEALANAEARGADLGDTLYESTEGHFVEDTVPCQTSGFDLRGAPSLDSQLLRRCCVFPPEPQSQGFRVVQSKFRECSSTAHAMVRRALSTNGSARLDEDFQQWGRLGAFLSSARSLWDTAQWPTFDYWLLGLLFTLCQRLRRQWVVRVGLDTQKGALLTYRQALRTVASTHTSPRPAISWHPHRDILATICSTGSVAVHTLGDAFTGSSTQYLIDDGSSPGFPLCLAWQPNDVRGALVVGMSEGISLWRRLGKDGWWCTWSLRGGTFMCPSLDWSPDGRSLAAVGDHGVVRVWAHTCLVPDEDSFLPGCVTLRRWNSGRAIDVRWNPDGGFLAVVHASAAGLILRLWDARTWEVSLHVRLGEEHPRHGTASLSWCSSDVLFAVADGDLVELAGLSIGGGYWSGGLEPGLEPSARLLPQVARNVEHIAVCPRTSQRVAVSFSGVPQLAVFERLGAEGWSRQDLAFQGLVGCAVGHVHPLPLALGFAANPVHTGHTRDSSFEGSLLAVLWSFGDSGSEIRTYPMHFLPYKLMQKDPNVLFT